MAGEDVVSDMGSLSPAAQALLARPGLPGPWGALLDECARAADDFCRVLEGFTLERFRTEIPSPDPDCRSPQVMAVHVCGAARRYADYIREALGGPREERHVLDPSRLAHPRDARPLLAAALRYTEETVDPMRSWDAARVEALTFRVRWGSLYDPEMLLEHAVCHLLRHRRQLERWPR